MKRPRGTGSKSDNPESWPKRPAIVIDQREIVWAEFVPLAEALRLPLGPEIAAYLAHPTPPVTPDGQRPA